MKCVLCWVITGRRSKEIGKAGVCTCAIADPALLLIFQNTLLRKIIMRTLLARSTFTFHCFNNSCPNQCERLVCQFAMLKHCTPFNLDRAGIRYVLLNLSFDFL